MYAELMPPKRGDLGYGPYCISLIKAGLCSCDGCHGNLTDSALSKSGWGHCRRCGCAQKVLVKAGHCYAAWVPSFGNCAEADRRMTEWRREQERQARRRVAAESLGDPRR